ncbi:MAG: SGNH/GDSL hydrolase family protein [Clostridia bacterium]
MAAFLLSTTALAVPVRAYGAPTAAVPVPVLIVGGSAAVGWVDDTGLGYVERGFLRYGEQAKMDFTFTNHAIPGARVVNPLVAHRYAGWVSATGPGGMVVLAWGLLNDLRLKTPLPAVKRRIRQQIRVALGHSDLVILVTPPATRATFERERPTERRMVRAEIEAARTFHSRRVYIADVFDRETAYLVAHHLAYRRYMAGRWDPNTRGHALAGRILGRELREDLPAARVVRQVRRLMAAGERRS